MSIGSTRKNSSTTKKRATTSTVASSPTPSTSPAPARKPAKKAPIPIFVWVLIALAVIFVGLTLVVGTAYFVLKKTDTPATPLALNKTSAPALPVAQNGDPKSDFSLTYTISKVAPDPSASPYTISREGFFSIKVVVASKVQQHGRLLLTLTNSTEKRVHELDIINPEDISGGRFEFKTAATSDAIREALGPGPYYLVVKDCQGGQSLCKREIKF